MKRFRKSAGITLYESSVQWYCFLIYATGAALVFDKVFFSNFSPSMAKIFSFLSFGIGYIAGPFGAIFFGHIGDKKGRKFTMYTSLLMMGIATSVIGILPPAQKIGGWVGLVLAGMRMLVCFARGGTWGGSILMAYENVPENKRNLVSALPQIGMPIGLLLASIFLLIPYYLMDSASYLAYGWRFAFLLAIVLSIIVVLLKGHMMETDDFKKAQAKLESKEEEDKEKQIGLGYMLRNYWRTLLLGCGTRWIDGTWYNVCIVWILSYCEEYLNMSTGHTLWIPVLACAFSIPFTMLGGHVNSKIGNTKTYSLGCLLVIIASIPCLKLVENSGGNLIWILFAIVVAWSIIYQLIWAVLGSLWSSYFPTELRYSGISFVYHVPSFLVAGLAPTISQYLIRLGNGNTVYVSLYIILAATVGIFCAYKLESNYKKGKS
ncbi:MFS transporter [Anaerococcus sp. AGMB00486]|uniref:MFS transporter n=3 Tax=Peptoniphilaceae TaxID=1570339 RepID=A0ABX2N971_9FIRM|nr:MHS family MFS transporter [Anaerococcus porci]NVF11228.1 MFS transporter [Anaerococcus faecalis]